MSLDVQWFEIVLEQGAEQETEKESVTSTEFERQSVVEAMLFKDNRLLMYAEVILELNVSVVFDTYPPSDILGRL